MRKAFMEPDMKVIKLNLNENIATSESTASASGLIYFYDDGKGNVVDTNINVDDISYYLRTGNHQQAFSDEEYSPIQKTVIDGYPGIDIAKCFAPYPN